MLVFYIVRDIIAFEILLLISAVVEIIAYVRLSLRIEFDVFRGGSARYFFMTPL
jgi:hypothetical protein